ncbi:MULTISPECIES: fused DSP-PTPase phosphatase/NAD kinase-like protein [unclassified Streptomyces]|uniref:fused DSP-PTPase phosphatase/NAD kinase-like protein n=1 Tax=unclassified Streptomyces TaxID=2593676 RepID=UPI002DD7CC94|nr:tyrosine-protein phosphatase [Streptomyces sp. NBC_00243]WRZ23343.1 tyrosine-protein phosphatase [Streptomyces sp. NBC_00243]
MAVVAAPPPHPTLPTRRLRRTILRYLVGVALGYLALWATGALGILALSYWAREETPAPAGTHSMQGVHNFQPVGKQGKLWRGAAPSPEGYRALARLGVTTVVDLRAEDLTAAQLAGPHRAGLDVVRLPVRDGQTPTPGQVERFLHVVGEASGPVFVHCGAGVGRTGAMAAAYLVRTGQQSPPAAVRRNLAVGPPSIEQIYYGLSLGPGRADQPPFPVIAISRLVDAPRRMWSWF